MGPKTFFDSVKKIKSEGRDISWDRFVNSEKNQLQLLALETTPVLIFRCVGGDDKQTNINYKVLLGGKLGRWCYKGHPVLSTSNRMNGSVQKTSRLELTNGSPEQLHRERPEGEAKECLSRVVSFPGLQYHRHTASEAQWYSYKRNPITGLSEGIKFGNRILQAIGW